MSKGSEFIKGVFANVFKRSDNPSFKKFLIFFFIAIAFNLALAVFYFVFRFPNMDSVTLEYRSIFMLMINNELFDAMFIGLSFILWFTPPYANTSTIGFFALAILFALLAIIFGILTCRQNKGKLRVILSIVTFLLPTMFFVLSFVRLFFPLLFISIPMILIIVVVTNIVVKAATYVPERVTSSPQSKSSVSGGGVSNSKSVLLAEIRDSSYNNVGYYRYTDVLDNLFSRVGSSSNGEIRNSMGNRVGFYSGGTISNSSYNSVGSYRSGIISNTFGNTIGSYDDYSDDAAGAAALLLGLVD